MKHSAIFEQEGKENADKRSGEPQLSSSELKNPQLCLLFFDFEEFDDKGA